MAKPFDFSWFDEVLLGCNGIEVAIIGVFWITLMIVICQDNNPIAICLGIGLSLLTAWLWGKFGFLLLWIAGGIIVLGGIIVFIVQTWNEGDIVADTITGIFIWLAGIGLIVAIVFLFISDAFRKMILGFGTIALVVVFVLALVVFFVWLGRNYYNYFPYRPPIGGNQDGGNQGNQRNQLNQRNQGNQGNQVLNRGNQGNQGYQGNPRDIRNRSRGTPIPDNPNRRR